MSTIGRTLLTASDVFLIGFKLTGHVLVAVARALEWLIKFVLHFVLYSINVLEAMISVVLQVLKMVKDIIRVLFNFGGLFYLVGCNIGAQGSFILLLCLFTYVCLWREGDVVNMVSNTSFIIIRVVCIMTWIAVVPVILVFVVITIKRTLTKLINSLVQETASQRFSIEGFVLPALTRSTYVDKSQSLPYTSSDQKVDEEIQTHSSGEEEFEERVHGPRSSVREKKTGRRRSSRGEEEMERRKSSGEEERGRRKSSGEEERGRRKSSGEEKRGRRKSSGEEEMERRKSSGEEERGRRKSSGEEERGRRKSSGEGERGRRKGKERRKIKN